MRIDEITDMYGDEVTGDVEDHPDYTSLDNVLDGTILQSIIRPHYNKKVKMTSPEGPLVKKLSLMPEVLNNKYLDEISEHWFGDYRMSDVSGEIKREYENLEDKYIDVFSPIFDPEEEEEPNADNVDLEKLNDFFEEVHSEIIGRYVNPNVL